MISNFQIRRNTSVALLVAFILVSAGCKKAATPADQPITAQVTPAARDDQQIDSDIQAKIAAETALSGQAIQVNVAGGVATLEGKVRDDSSRALAAADSASVDGVRTVVNNLVVAPLRTAVAAPLKKKRRALAEAPPPPPPAATPPPPPAQEEVRIVPPPPPPPAPEIKTVTLPAGTVIPIRMSDTLDSQSTQPNTVFHGSLAGDLIVDGVVVARTGANVLGRVISAKDATHFSGASELSIEATRIDTVDHPVDVVTDAFTKQGAGRGKNTALKTGGGAAVGAILGGILGGGKGAAIGAASGGGIGAGVNGVTRGQQVQIPTETLVNFRLTSPVSVKISRMVGGSRESYNGDGLQQRQ